MNVESEKFKLVEKLLKKEHINFREAIMLLETEKEYIYNWSWYQGNSGTTTVPAQDLLQPPYTITCGTGLIDTIPQPDVSIYANSHTAAVVSN